MSKDRYKIKVNTRKEGIEAQEHFFQLGYGFEGCTSHKLISNEFDFNYLFAHVDSDLTISNSDQVFNSNDYKELNLYQLRDLVVLHRNDINDATHKDNSIHNRMGFLSSDGVEYFWSYFDLKWFKSEQHSFETTKLKPIKIEKMKEWLDPEDGYSLVTAVHALPHWIEVPEGSEGYYQYRKGEDDNEFFLKKIGDTYYFANEESRYSWEWYAGELKGHEFALWQREEAAQQHKKMVSIRVENKTENNTMEDSDFMNLIGQILGNEFTDIQKTLINLALNK